MSGYYYVEPGVRFHSGSGFVEFPMTSFTVLFGYRAVRTLINPALPQHGAFHGPFSILLVTSPFTHIYVAIRIRACAITIRGFGAGDHGTSCPATAQSLASARPLPFESCRCATPHLHGPGNCRCRRNRQNTEDPFSVKARTLSGQVN